MSTKRFCDVCDRPLKNDDTLPFARQLIYTIPSDEKDFPAGEERSKAVLIASVQVTNRNNHILTDICHACILRSVTDGTPVEPPTTIATLQPRVAADEQPSVALFQTPPPPTPILPEKPPQPPQPARPAAPQIFEPSLPGDRPSPRVG
jgi:hypothetical protein